MTEFLSMTMLSTEPVSVAKPQAAQSNDAGTEPDQSFAATLAAEVNGKTPEKSGKTSSKTRQNTASEVQENKETLSEQNTTAADLKDNKPVSGKESAQGDKEELVSEASDKVKVQSEAVEAEHSHWLNLLDKAKSLQARLNKAEAGEAKAGSLAEDSGLQGTKAKQQHEKATAAELSDAEAAVLSKVKAAQQKDGAVVLDQKLVSEQNSEQHLTSEELNALKLITQSDKTTAKNQTADHGLTKLSTAQNTETESTDKPDAKLAVQKDTGPDQNKIMAHIERPLKIRTEAIQARDSEQQPAADAEIGVTVTTVSKTPLQSEQAAAMLKGTTVATVSSEQTVGSNDDTDNEMLTAHAAATDAKPSVQAQSAAALLAPQPQQNKSSAAEAKVTTEELLKQLQTAAVATHTEQGTSSSSGKSSQQGSTETLLTVIEQQKTTNAPGTEANSFGSQLKSNLEKISSGLSVSGRELVSEASQKQADQLGQKLNLLQPEASNQLKEKMLMMVKDKVHTAEIRLDPSELGSMQIKISLQQDQMSVQFMVQQGNAKELMEQQMPKLKELLQQQGIELSQGSVQQQNQSSAGQEGGRRTAGGTGSGVGQGSSEELIDPALLPPKASDRVVDYYA